MYTGGSFLHTAANTRTYGRWIVFKTAGGSQALEPSCDLVLPQRPGPIALRLQAEFQYTRIFNERSPPPRPLSLRDCPFGPVLHRVPYPRSPGPSSSLLPSSSTMSPFLIVFPTSPLYTFASPPPRVFLFPRFSPLGFLRAPLIPGQLVRSAAESAFYISPPRIARSRAAREPSTGIYRRLNGPGPRPSP